MFPAIRENHSRGHHRVVESESAVGGGEGTITGQWMEEGDDMGEMNMDEVIYSLQAYLEELTAADVFSGAVLVAKDGRPIFAQAKGLASRAFQAPNRLDTKFNLGSMNKMFTAVAIAQLAEAGRLAFTDRVAAYLPDFPRGDAARTMTIHHLLTHSSGLGSYWNERFETIRDQIRNVNDYLGLFADDPLLFAPGERSEYSNAGYIVLGAIIERITGQSYDAYVRERIYLPVGMNDTGFYPLDRDVPNRAGGYTHFTPDGETAPEEWWNNLLMLPACGGPGGGGYSTVEDLLRFARALLAHELLSPEMTATVLAAKVALRTRAFSRYGYGFGLEHVEETLIVGHTGGAPGINAQLDIYPGKGYVVAVLANYDPPAASLVAQKVRALVIPASQG